MSRKKHKIYNFSIFEPKYFVKKVWERSGKTLDQRILFDFYRVIIDYLTEKMILENYVKIDGLGTFILVKNKNKKITYPIENRLFHEFLNLRFYPDNKIKNIIKLFTKKWRNNVNKDKIK